MLKADDLKPIPQTVHRVYPPNLQSLLQSLLKTLADIDFEFEQECERVHAAVQQIDLREYLLEKLREKHGERRRPYVEHLSVLQRQITTGAW